jgi:hypothetical protein
MSEPHMNTIMRVAGDVCRDSLSKALLLKVLSRSTEPMPEIMTTPWHRPGNSAINIAQA